MGASKSIALAKARHEIPSEAHFPFSPKHVPSPEAPAHALRGPRPRMHFRVSEVRLPRPRKAAALLPPHARARAPSAAQQPFSPPGAHCVRTPCPRAAAASLIGRAPGKQGTGSQWEGCARGQHESPGERSRGAPSAGYYIERPSGLCSERSSPVRERGAAG